MLPATEKLIKQLRKANLPLEDRSALHSVLLEKVNALPLSETIVLVPQGIQINGRVMQPDQAAAFKEACVALDGNFARKLIREQVKFLAIVQGIHKALSVEHIIFAKAAFWLMEQEDKVILDVVTQGLEIRA